MEAFNSISSTIVRDLVKQQKSVKYFTDDAVIEYIEQNKLYLWKKLDDFINFVFLFTKIVCILVDSIDSKNKEKNGRTKKWKEHI